MPLGVFVPAGLNDLAGDVQVGTPAQGSVFYRGGSFWNALAPGTAGQVLTSGGAGADPSWTTPAGGGGAFVSLAPSTPTVNTIVPTADANMALTLKSHSLTQSAPLLQVLRSDNTQAFTLYDTGNLFINHQAGAATILNCLDVAAGVAVFSLFKSGVGGIAQFTVGADADPLLQLFGNSPTQAGNLLECYPDSGTLTTRIDGKGNLILVADAVAGSQIGTASSQRLGFFGAAPVVRPALAAAATDLASVIALANSLRSGQIALGLGA